MVHIFIPCSYVFLFQLKYYLFTTCTKTLWIICIPSFNQVGDVSDCTSPKHLDKQGPSSFHNHQHQEKLLVLFVIPSKSALKHSVTAPNLLTNTIVNFEHIYYSIQIFLKEELKTYIYIYIYTYPPKFFDTVSIGSHEWWHEFAISYMILKNTQNIQGTLRVLV